MAPENGHRATGNMSSVAEMDDESNSSEKKPHKRGLPLDKNSEAYKRRRERNNLAVKKSRSKSKMKTQETLERVNKLKVENEVLEAKIKLLSKELSFLKDLFLAHAGSAHGQNLQDLDLTMFGEPTHGSCSNGQGTPGETDHEYTTKTTVKTECKD